MKIDILHNPPADIFHYQRPLTIIFVALVLIACVGIGIGVYAIVGETSQYEKLEMLALLFFVGPAPFASFFGEKLQAYKRLTRPQETELQELINRHPEVKKYCLLVTLAKRRFIRAEFEALQAWAEEAQHRH